MVVLSLLGIHRWGKQIAAAGPLDLLTPTDHETHCPFKGMAYYWSITAADKSSENAVWSYERPYDETAELKDHMASYANRMDDVIVSGE